MHIHLVLDTSGGHNLDDCLDVAIAAAKSHAKTGRIVFRFNEVRFDVTRKHSKEELLTYYHNRLKEIHHG